MGVNMKQSLLLAACLVLLCSSLMAQTRPPPSLPSAPPLGANAALSRLETLGERLFTDRALSEPAGTACINCHAPRSGFASNNGSRSGVARGSRAGALGLRNAMTNAYGAFVPKFSFRVENGAIDPIGGHFWDGRADTLAAQALAPFLAAVEMNNPDAASVVRKVAASNYANLMRAEFGNGIFNTPELAFQKLGAALAAFESSQQFQTFSSKYDFFVQGKLALAANELRGMKLFMDPRRGNCASCHLMNPTSKNPEDSLFADFAFYATGIPRNRAIAENANPSFFDLGLCGPKRVRPALAVNVPGDVAVEKFCGTFRIVTLRNVAERQAFMHNGVFKDLREVVSFYATRNSDPRRWYGPAGVPNDLPLAYVGNIIADRAPFNRPQAAGPALNPAEINDIVAFLHTLSDGFVIEPALPQAGQSVAPVQAPPPPPPGGALNPFGGFRQGL